MRGFDARRDSSAQVRLAARRIIRRFPLTLALSPVGKRFELVSRSTGERGQRKTTNRGRVHTCPFSPEIGEAVFVASAC